MRKNNKWFNSRTAIIIAGVLLTAYLILILAVTNFGQSRLKVSQNNALYLKVLNYSDNLSYFFDVSKEEISHLANDNAINTYFLNRAAGMSFKYGLGTSLFNLKQKLARFIKNNRVDHHFVFNNIYLLGIGGTIIAEEGHQHRLHITNDELSRNSNNMIANVISIPSEQGARIYIIHKIFLQKKYVATLVAEINQKVLIHKLTSQEHEYNQSRLTLVTPSIEIPVWNTLSSPPQTLTKNRLNYFKIANSPIYFKDKIEGTSFELHTWFEPVTEQDIFTSAWFIAGISVLAFPVLLGLVYLLKVNNANLVLKTQIDASAQQQKKLSSQNDLLQQEIKKRKISENQLAYQAHHDQLTGLFNRVYSLRFLSDQINNAIKTNQHILVIFIDLDNFKHVNDSLGHHAGDILLKKTGERLLNVFKPKGLVSRFGGDEFLIIVPNIISRENANLLAKSILSVFEQPFVIEQQEFFISTSIGLSLFPFDGNNAEELIKNADTALYQVKEIGRNGFNFYDQHMNIEMQRKLALNGHLYQAVATNKIDIFYQPIIDIQSKKIIAAEALLRWTDERLGVISPAEFIPIAEKNGLIHKLGLYVLNRACIQAKKWQQWQPLKIAINFSSVQFRDCEALKKSITEALQDSGLSANKLIVEVTESLLIEHDEQVISAIKFLKNLGIELSIDDFGTGYSSLSYLQKFSFSSLKIDKSFIANLTQNDADRALVAAIIAMANSLKLNVVAEGIEDLSQMAFLQQQGCLFGQGYLFSKPICANEFTQLLIKQNHEENALACM